MAQSNDDLDHDDLDRDDLDRDVPDRRDPIQNRRRQAQLLWSRSASRVLLSLLADGRWHPHHRLVARAGSGIPVQFAHRCFLRLMEAGKKGYHEGVEYSVRILLGETHLTTK